MVRLQDRALTASVLGVLQVRRDGAALELGPVQQRVVLAVLLLHAGRAVSRDALITAVWGEAAPKSVVNLVHRHASGVRRVLEPERASRSAESLLTWTNSAYRLALPPGALDVEAFETAVSRAQRQRLSGHPAEAAETLREALALWRGPLCDGLTSPFLDAERDRLAEQRLRATADRIELDLVLGSPADLVGELRPLVAEHPSQERLHGLLMRALYREGRPADALAAYGAARRYLREQLGIDPSEPLRQIHRRVLEGDPTLAAPVADGTGAAAGQAELVHRPASGETPRRPAAPAQLPHALADFVGREAELALLHEGVAESAAATAPLIAAVAGTAGVGKTTLAVHWAHEVKARFPDGQIYLNLRGFDPHLPPTEPAVAIRGLLDALGVPADRLPLDPEAQAGLYRSELARGRFLLLLDNARDAAQVRPLLPGSPGSMVLVTSRDQLVSLVAVDGARPVALNLLSDDVARRLLARRLGAARVEAEPAAVERIIEACARLPLALSIVAARASTNPRFSLERLADELRRARGTLDPFDGGELDVDVRAVFSWSYTGLTEPAARLFRLLALVPGPDVPAPAAGALAELPVGLARNLLAQLNRANLVSERAPGRFGMHDLLRAYAGELVAATDAEETRRAALRRLLDHYLHTAHRADHLLNEFRDDPIELEPAMPGISAEPLRDHQDALAWFVDEQPALAAAVRRAASTGFDGHVWRLAWTLTHFLDRHGQWHESAAVHEAGVRAAERLGDVRGQAVSHAGYAYALIRLQQPDDAEAHLVRALGLHEQLGDALGMAHAHRSLGWVMEKERRWTDGLHHAERALELFGATGREGGTARAMNALGWFHYRLGDDETSLRFCERALGIQRRIGARFDQADTLDSVGRAYRRLGRFAESAACHEEARELYREFGDRYTEADELVVLGEVRMDAGDTDAARAAWEDALRLFEELGHADAESVRARLGALAEPALER